jgi:hypothetical protein
LYIFVAAVTSKTQHIKMDAFTIVDFAMVEVVFSVLPLGSDT